MQFLILNLLQLYLLCAINANQALLYQDALGNTELHNYLHPFDLANQEKALELIKKYSKEEINLQNTYGETVLHRMLKCTDTFMHYEWIGLYEDPFYSFVEEIEVVEKEQNRKKRGVRKSRLKKMQKKKMNKNKQIQRNYERLRGKKLFKIHRNFKKQVKLTFLQSNFYYRVFR